MVPSFAKHCRLHCNSQLSPCVFDGFFKITIFRTDEINASQPSSIVEFGFLVCPFLVLFPLSGCSNFGPYFWPYMIWSGSRLNFSFNRVNFVMPFHEADKLLFKSTLQSSSTRFFLHDVQISVSRPCYINVFQWNGNVSSFGT